MENLDYDNVLELQALGDSLTQISEQLANAKKELAETELEVYRSLAGIQGVEKLSQKNQMVVLGRSRPDLVERFLRADAECGLLKHSYDYAVEMVNLKKHINNITPRG